MTNTFKMQRKDYVINYICMDIMVLENDNDGELRGGVFVYLNILGFTGIGHR